MKLLYSHLSPRPVDPTLRMSLLLLHSFHSHCPSTALILFSAQTDRIACLWPPALTSILHTAAICTPIVTHTHTHFPQSIMSKCYCMVFPNSCSLHLPASPRPSVPRASVQTGLSWAGRSLQRLLTLIPFLSHRLSFPTSRLKWSVPISVVLSHLCGAFLISLFFHKTLLLITDISVHVCDG